MKLKENIKLTVQLGAVNAKKNKRRRRKKKRRENH
jgi:hypothetical protein